MLALLKLIRNPVSGLTHLFADILSFVGLVYLYIYSVRFGNIWHTISFVIFGISLCLLYSASAMYHILPVSEAKLKTLKRFDHMMIYVLIAGSYTPFCLIPLRGPVGWTIFGIIWAMAILGIIFKSFWLYAPRWISTVLYLIMGWVIIFAIRPLSHILSADTLFWLVLGGIIYSVGAIVYVLKWPNPIPEKFGFHEIWHLFVMGGSFCHFWAIFRHILWMK